MTIIAAISKPTSNYSRKNLACRTHEKSGLEVEHPGGWNMFLPATDGCGASPTFVQGINSWANVADVAGKIVLIDRGVCGFAVKALNAQRNGAIGVIVGNVASSPNSGSAPGMSGTSPAEAITIPVASLSLAAANLLRTELGASNVVNATLTVLPGTGNSYRWLIGEDVFGGAFRDMWNRNCYGRAAKVSDSNYYCGIEDNGGVHRNSGPPSHAYALLVDGGTYNGQTISPIGLTKAAAIYWHNQSVYQGVFTEFAGDADGLEQSCLDLIGQPINELSLTAIVLSQSQITQSDCDQVEKAMLAVELRTPPPCIYTPLLAKNPPPMCVERSFYAAGFETGVDGYTANHMAVFPADFTERDWTIASVLPDARAGRAFFADDSLEGICELDQGEASVLYLFSPQILIPGSVTPVLSFDHWIAAEARFDGGNLKISVNNGPFQLVAASDFIYNPYNLTLRLAPPAQNNTNPMAGEPAFSGTDLGSFYGSCGQSQVNLSNYAQPGDTVQLRFDFGVDSCRGHVGWYIDDIHIYDVRTQVPTSCGVGQCASTGYNTCTAGVFNDTCTPGAPVTEICDGLDNDCDASTDESGYLFVGFAAPVDNLPIENVAKAGSAVPLKFSATTCTGAPVTDLTAPQVTLTSVLVSCSDNTALDDAIEEYVAGSSALQNFGDGSYQINWKSSKSDGGTCREIRVNLGDGVLHKALFKLTK